MRLNQAFKPANRDSRRNIDISTGSSPSLSSSSSVEYTCCERQLRFRRPIDSVSTAGWLLLPTTLNTRGRA